MGHDFFRAPLPPQYPCYPWPPSTEAEHQLSLVTAFASLFLLQQTQVFLGTWAPIKCEKKELTH